MSFAVAVCLDLGAAAAPGAGFGALAVCTPKVILPVEIFGAAGTEASVELGPLSDAAAREVVGLALKVHGLEFEGMASVQLNGGAWRELNNATARVLEPGRSYGGIGGGFGTLDLVVPIPPGSAKAGDNMVCFRFNHTDGVSSGFRVLAVNLANSTGEGMIPQDVFLQESPASWRAPLEGSEAVESGRRLWSEASLVANGLPGARPIRAHCADCHAQDGRDLRYFNFSNLSIITRSQFHGLTETEGREIASYIRGLRSPNPGRPWNPPFQPGPGLSEKSAVETSAGAGLEWAGGNEQETIRHLLGGDVTSEAVLRSEPFRADADLDARDIPISMQLPDWNHWLPRVHPIDAWGAAFEAGRPMELYRSLLAKLGSTEGRPGFERSQAATVFAQWVSSQKNLLESFLPGNASGWTRELGTRIYSTQQWQLVKAWEMSQEYASSGAYAARGWPNLVPMATAPSAAHIPDGPSGMGGSALTNEYFSNAWYELQLLTDGSLHGRESSLRVDTGYIIGRSLALQEYSHRPEPGRVMVALIKAMQSTDQGSSPRQPGGWRPDRNIDPRVMVSPRWSGTFASIPRGVRAAFSDSLLRSWLEKNRQYPVASYFSLSRRSESYTPPDEIADFYGGRAWLAVPEFEHASVDGNLVRQLERWGRSYTDAEARFSY